MPEECILVFQTTHRTLQAEDILKKEKIKIKIVLKPRSITTDCGLAINFNCDKKDSVINIIKNNRLVLVGIYKKAQNEWILLNSGK